MTTPGDRIRDFCTKQGLTQAERDYLLGVLGEAVTVEREACASLAEAAHRELAADPALNRHATASSGAAEVGRRIRARGGP